MIAERMRAPHWYLVHTNPKQEDRADSNLRAWGVETFNPKLKEIRWNAYGKEAGFLVKPLFPGYVFARFEFKASFHKIRFTRGVHSVVCFGNGPALVDDEIISLVKSRLDVDHYVTIEEDFKPGDSVLIKDGPLKTFTGIFERKMKGSDRVMILINTVGFQAHCQVEMSLLSKVAV